MGWPHLLHFLQRPCGMVGSSPSAVTVRSGSRYLVSIRVYVFLNMSLNMEIHSF